MPVLPAPDYTPPFLFRSGNIATLYPPLFRPTPLAAPSPERIETPDKDFLDIDWHRSRIGQTRKLVVISHGLEGHSRKKYVLGMARMATGLGYDSVCWSQRGCSGEPNRLAHSYHSGKTDDLHTVITHCLNDGQYDEVALIGFSMGGNQILKYLGEAPDLVPNEVRKAVTFSVPCDLSATERVIARTSKRIYLEYFMKGLREKVYDKHPAYPETVDPVHLKKIGRLRDFENYYTAPLNGFKDAEDYYTQSSCKQFLPHIRIPTLLVNAKDDPFLPSRCYPVVEAENNPNLYLEMPKYGGHVGFVAERNDNMYWSEKRAGEFILAD